MKNLCKIFFLCYMQRTEKVQDRKTITYIIQMNAFENGFIAILLNALFTRIAIVRERLGETVRAKHCLLLQLYILYKNIYL